MQAFHALRVMLKQNEITQQDLAKVIGRSEVYISQRLRGLECFTLDECYTIMDLLRLDKKDMYFYFPREGKWVERKQEPIPEGKVLVSEERLRILKSIFADIV